MSFKEFQKAPNRLTQRDIGFLIVAAIVLALVVYLLALTNNYLANLWPEGGEFTLLRAGGRAFLFDRVEPYSGTVPALVQEQVYGRRANMGEDQYVLDIPFHLLMIFFPLALFPEGLVARIFWLAFLEVALAAFIYLSFRSMERKIPAVFIVLIAIAVLASFYTYLSLQEGSPVLLLGLAYAGLLVALRAGQDELAGALLALCAFQWEIGGPFLCFVLLWAFWEKRWRVFAGAGMLAVILIILSFFWYPGWLLPFLRAAWNSFRAGFGFSSHDILSQLWPQSAGYSGWILTGGLIFTLGLEWFAARWKNFDHFLWVACLTLAATPLLGQHVEIDHLFPLTLPVMLTVIILRERWKRLGDGIAVLLLWTFFGLPWIVHLEGLPEGIGLDKEVFLFLLWPVLTVVCLYWVRWWMVRPPRTWLEGFAHQRRT